jgi:peptidylprolyl isomerase
MKKLLFMAPALLLFACGPDYEETEFDIEIGEYLNEKEWTADRQESGLYIITEKEGSEEKPTLKDFVTINYTGYLLDGTVFDSNGETPVTFPLGNLIEGWQEGIPHFGRGGKGKLIIPPGIGYGDRASGPIPANSVLVFDIEVFDFSNTPPVPKIVDIDEYIMENGIEGMVKSESGLYMSIENPGSDEKPTINDFLTLTYTGYLTDGTVFDGTEEEPITFSFPMSDLILGWQEGIPNLGRGGKAKFIIPPHLGYGERDNGAIPGYSVLVFDLEIFDFSSTPPAQ